MELSLWSPNKRAEKENAFGKFKLQVKVELRGHKVSAGVNNGLKWGGMTNTSPIPHAIFVYPLQMPFLTYA